MTLDDVAAIAAGLPDVSEAESRGWRTWVVAKKMFTWERPFSKADLKRWTEPAVPDGPIVAVRTDGLDEKVVVLAAGITGVFTIPHLDGYPAVLIDLAVAEPAAVSELVVDAWLAAAPRRLVERYLADR